jgi:metallo-beta-lactamase family protein
MQVGSNFILQNNLEKSKKYCINRRILLAPNTPGGMLRNGIKEIKLFGEIKQVRVQIELMDSFFSHGDQAEMFNFIKNQIPSAEKTFLVHGDERIIT